MYRRQNKIIEHPCTKCKLKVSNREEALSCDKCGGWTHPVKCQTLVSREEYRRLRNGEEVFPFICDICVRSSVPEIESRLVTEDAGCVESASSEEIGEVSIVPEIESRLVTEDAGFVVCVQTVLKKLLEIIPQDTASVLSVVADFEKAFWKAARKELGVTVRGCGFHWAQAVERHIKSLGLYSDFVKDPEAKRLIEMVFGLQYVPAAHIRPLVTHIRKLSEDGRFQTLMEYVESTWLNKWEPCDWSQFYQVIRTNNAVEGWHNRLKSRALGRNGCPPFYMLVDLLHRESKAVNLRLKLLSQGKLQKRIRKQTNENNAILFELWDAYNNQTITAKTLLMKAAKTVKTK